jgi:cellulose biosynthesis protein BcsQ
MEIPEALKKQFDALKIDKHPRSICISNYKGGVGKTTITTLLGYYLAHTGKKVLLFDIDPQCSLSLAVGFEPEKVDRTTYTIYHLVTPNKWHNIKKVKFNEYVDDIPDKFAPKSLKIIKGAFNVDELDIEITRAIVENDRTADMLFGYCRNMLNSFKDFDYILIDCPPNKMYLTQAMLRACTYFLTVTIPDKVSVYGMPRLLRWVRQIPKNEKPKMLGVVLNAVNRAGGNDNNQNVHYPAAFNTVNANNPNPITEIIAVAATDQIDHKASFSTFGPWIDVCAPGVDIFSTNSQQQVTTIPGFDYKSGTSMATPQVAGLCGLILSLNPALTPAQVKNCVVQSCTNIDAINPGFTGLLGAGRINAPLALQCASGNNNAFFMANTTTACTGQNITLTGYPNGANGGAGWTWTFSQPATVVSQNANQIVVNFANGGNVNVTLNMTINGVPTSVTYNNYLTIASPYASFDKKAIGDMCNGSAQQIVLNFFNTTPPFTYTVSNAGVPSNFQGDALTEDYFFNASIANPTLLVTNITDANGCTSNANSTLNLSVINCCSNLVANGDFEAGSTGFISDNVLVGCTIPNGNSIHGAFSVVDVSPAILPNTFYCAFINYAVTPNEFGANPANYNGPRNAMLRLDGRCGPDQLGGINPLNPLANNTGGLYGGYLPGVESILWQQNNIAVASGNTYNVDFFMATDGGNAWFPNMIRFDVIDQATNTVLLSSNNFVLPATNKWNQYSFSWNNNLNGNVRVRILQVNYFGGSAFDMNIDDVSITGTSNQNTLTLTVSGNCIPNNATVTITPTTNVINPLYQLNGVNATPPFVVPAGNYTVTVINDPLCIATQTVSIYNLPTVTANASQNPLCSNSLLTLTGGGANTYIWTGGVINGAPFSPPVGVTIYTVTGTDVNGCTSTSSIIVTVNQSPTVTATAQPPIICPGDVSNLSATGANTYVWQPGNLAGANQTVSPIGTTTYTVTGTTGNCTSTSTVTVTVLPANAIQCACPNAPPVTFTNPLASQILAYYGVPQTVAGQSFSVVGTLAVDVDINFVSTTINFAPNAEIWVGTGTTLQILDNSLLYACSDMWEGIFAFGPNKHVVVSLSTIKHMKQGVYISGGATLQSLDSKYHDNYVGIYLNVCNNNYGEIKSCEFKTIISPLKPPYNLQNRGEHGVVIYKGENITIGDPLNSLNKNTFENLYNGIYIKDENYLSFQNTITTTYNTFKNIKGGPSLMGVNAPPWGTPYNLQYRGSAIFGNSTVQTNDTWLKHYGHDNATIDFEECEKAILVNGFNTEIHDSRVATTNSNFQPEAGFLTYKDDGKTIQIRRNKILNTILGIHLNGNTYFCDIHENEIETKTIYDYNTWPNPTYFTTKAIDVAGYTLNNAIGGKIVDYNTINISNTVGGEGITVYKTAASYIKQNEIHFSSNDPAPDITTRPTLIGIKINKCEIGNVINNISMLDNIGVLTNRRTLGIELAESPMMSFDCNSNNDLHWGMFVRGNCTVLDYDEFKQNRFRTRFYGILHRHLGSQGYLGKNIGNFDVPNSIFFDPNNQFQDLQFLNFRLYRFVGGVCNAATPTSTFHTKLTANTLDQNNVQHSWSSLALGDCKNLIDNANFTNNQIANTCVPQAFNIQGEDGGEPIEESFDLEHSIDVINDSVNYSEYPAMAKWFDERALLNQLSTSDSLLTIYPTMSSFYTVRQLTSMDILNKIDRHLNKLSDTTIMKDSSAYQYALLQASTLNTNLASAEQHVLNEKWINALYLRLRFTGNDSISVQESQDMDALASQCPYLGGEAVYKARMLNAMFFPTKQYNDLLLCNNAGVYKNGNGLFDDEDRFLDSIMNIQTIHSQIIVGDQVKIYPNPAQTQITISYEIGVGQDAKIVMLDMSGRTVQIIELSPTNNKVTTKLLDLANGLYTYKYIVNNHTKETGKVIIFK